MKKKLSEDIDKNLGPKTKKRDHIKIGRELNFFATSKLIGSGLPFLMPKGARVIQLLQRFVEDEEQARGYLLTKTPLLAKRDLFALSGHWPHFKDRMFITADEEAMVLKAATCPFHFSVYNAQLHSYRDLPLRYSEASTLFRKATSSETHGLVRLRQFTVSEGHIICSEEQVIDEFKEALNLATYFMQTLGFGKDVLYTLSKWNESNKGKYVGETYLWERVQNLLYDTVSDLNLDFTVLEGKAPFYGPKFDVNLKSAYEKQERIITIQLDFSLAKMFGMTYVDMNNKKKHPIILHRTSVGSYERMLAMLLEKYDGAMPTWLSPTQVKVLTTSEKYNDYAKTIVEKLRNQKVRVEEDFRREKLSYKIKNAQFERVPYALIIGEKEQQNATVAVRSRSKGEEGSKNTDDVIARILLDIHTKSLEAVMNSEI
ncbi:MAG: threonine--tRNA ligase [Nitrososphaerota archaeon]|jgi:threonyl-tRNA synthetase|nr:threonine--tRNA ligase [Nitrososphaerota archaeon]